MTPKIRAPLHNFLWVFHFLWKLTTSSQQNETQFSCSFELFKQMNIVHVPLNVYTINIMVKWLCLPAWSKHWKADVMGTHVCIGYSIQTDHKCILVLLIHYKLKKFLVWSTFLPTLHYTLHRSDYGKVWKYTIIIQTIIWFPNVI